MQLESDCGFSLPHKRLWLRGYGLTGVRGYVKEIQNFTKRAKLSKGNFYG